MAEQKVFFLNIKNERQLAILLDALQSDSLDRKGEDWVAVHQLIDEALNLKDYINSRNRQ